MIKIQIFFYKQSPSELNAEFSKVKDRGHDI